MKDIGENSTYTVGGMDSRALFVGLGDTSYDCFALEKKFFAERADAEGEGYLSLCVLGECRVFLNGKKLKTDILSPYTEFNRRSAGENGSYRIPAFSGFTRIVSQYPLEDGILRTGENHLRIEVSGGFYCQKRVYTDYIYGSPAVMASIVSLKEGEYRTLLYTDDSFRAVTLPVTAVNVYYGETLDLRQLGRERELSVKAEENPPEVKLLPKTFGGDRITRRIRCRLLCEREGVSVYDIGTNTTFLPVIGIGSGEEAEVAVRFSEILDDETGLPDYRTYFGEDRMIFRILTDGKPHVCTSSFTLFAGRYVCVYGKTTEVWVDEVLPDMPVTAEWESSSPVLDGYVRAFLRSAQTNFHSGIPSDCPHRERLGYTGDGQLTCSALLWFTDMRARGEKWLNDIRDCQDSVTGRVPHVAPWIPAGGGPGGWGSAVIFLPWRFYCFYGEIRWLTDNYAAMKRWIGYLVSHSEGGIQNREEPDVWCLGEWCTPGEVILSPAYVNTCFLLEELALMERIASVLGEEADRAYYSSLAASVREAMEKRAATDPAFSPLQDRQGGVTFAYDAGLIDRKTAKEHLASYEGRPIDTGIFGTPKLFEQLFALGLPETAVSLLLRTGCPSFGYMLAGGSDTLWEDWTGSDHRPGGTVTSRNHPMFGGTVPVLWEWLAGIRQKENSVGYRELAVEPFLTKQLSFLKCGVCLPTGKLTLHWRREGPTVSVLLTAPENAGGLLKVGGQTVRFRGGETVSLTVME